MPPKAPPLGPEAAEALALHAVAMIVADEDLLVRFLGLTGCDARDVRQRVHDPDFLGAVLDFVLHEDALVHKLAETAGIGPDRVLLARMKLPGAQIDWTP